MAETAGVRYRPFTDVQEDKTKEMQRLVLEYVKTLKEITTHVPTSTEPVNPQAATTIRLNEDEFPILPDIKILQQCNRDDSEDILSRYIKQHYRESCLGQQCAEYVRQHLTCSPDS